MVEFGRAPLSTFLSNCLALVTVCLLPTGAATSTAPLSQVDTTEPPTAAMAEATQPAKERPDVHAVLEYRDDVWEIEFRFTDPQRAVVFRQSSEPYRTGHWTSLTQGAQLERRNRLDVMTFDRPATRARFRLVPNTDDLPKAYTPFLGFGDGSWGVLTGQFQMSRASGREQMAAFPGTAADWPDEPLRMHLTIQSDQPIWLAGEVHTDVVRLNPEGDGTYAYVGTKVPVSGESFVGMIDEALPGWIRSTLDDDLKRIFGELTRAWEFALPERATVLFVFKGADTPGLSFTGGAIDNLLSLEIGGADAATNLPEVRDMYLLLLAHEATHLYQSAAGLAFPDGSMAWIHEGSADTMAHRIAALLAADPARLLAERYSEAFANCTDHLAGDTLEKAIDTGSYGAYYACGDLIATMVEASMTRGNIYTFWQALAAQARHRTPPQPSTDDFFRVAESFGVPRPRIARLRRLVSTRLVAPTEELAALLEESGLFPVFEEGRLISLTLPGAEQSRIEGDVRETGTIADTP
jgi:hypothetical protein